MPLPCGVRGRPDGALKCKGQAETRPRPRDSSSRQASSAPGPAVPAADLQVSLWGLSSESGSCFIHCNALFPFSDPKWPQFKSLTQLWAQGGVGEWSSLPECAQRSQRRPPCPTPTSTGVLLSLMCYCTSCSTSAVQETALRHMTKMAALSPPAVESSSLQNGASAATEEIVISHTALCLGKLPKIVKH